MSWGNKISKKIIHRLGCLYLCWNGENLLKSLDAGTTKIKPVI